MPSNSCDEVNISERRHTTVPLFQTLLPTQSVTFISIILPLASLWRWHYWSMVVCFSTGALLPAESKLQQRRKYRSRGLWCLFSHVLMVRLPGLLHCSRQVMCEVSYPCTPDVLYCPPTAPFSHLNPRWERWGWISVWPNAGQLC